MEKRKIYLFSTGGTIEKIERGARRFPEKIVIKLDGAEGEENFNSYTLDQISSLIATLFRILKVSISSPDNL